MSMLKRRLFQTIPILAVALLVYWQRGQFERTEPIVDGPPPRAATVPRNDSAVPEKSGKYDRLEGCRLVEDRRNDGDSFLVRYGSHTFHLRLYFVDCPEKYLSDRYENQRRRVADQARELGGITLMDAVEVGKMARDFTARLLRDQTFTVYTYWEQVYDGDRYYGFVELPESAEFLGNALIREGLARIHTKGPGSKSNPIPTPKGDSFHHHRDLLQNLERQARNARHGAWGM